MVERRYTILPKLEYEVDMCGTYIIITQNKINISVICHRQRYSGNKLKQNLIASNGYNKRSDRFIVLVLIRFPFLKG